MLALAIGGRTVTELQATMPQKEFMQWIEFYKLSPFDDYHRIHRPTVLLSKGLGLDMEKAFEWLAPEPEFNGLSHADINTFKAFGIKPIVKE